MSSHYSAGQFEDSFTPRRLGNWAAAPQCVKVNFISNANNRKVPVKFIANERGHLLPGIPKKLESPWNSSAFGDQKLEVLRNNKGPEAYKDAPPVYSRSQRGSSNRFESIRKPTTIKIEDHVSKEIGDPLLNYLRHKKLPVIWVIGHPTEISRKKRAQTIKYIAERLNYSYVNLDHFVHKWIGRGWMTGGVTNPRRSISSEHYCKQTSSFLFGRSVDKTSLSEDEANNSITNPIDNEIAQIPSHFKIQFDTADAFSSSIIVELLKHAMVECLPTHGFIIEGFPCNLQEADEFERRLYRIGLALNFVTGPVDNISGFRVNAQTRKPTYQDPYVPTKKFRRKLHFSTIAEKEICNKYGHKIIRVIETENIDKETMEFILQVIRDNLKKYSDICDGRHKVDYQREEQLQLSDDDVLVQESSSPSERCLNVNRNNHSSSTSFYDGSSSSNLVLEHSQASSRVQQRKKQELSSWTSECRPSNVLGGGSTAQGTAKRANYSQKSSPSLPPPLVDSELFSIPSSEKSEDD